MTYDYKFIKQVKQTIQNELIPPHYHSYKYRYTPFNCYAYALRLCIDCSDYWIGPGFISRKKKMFLITKKNVIRYFKKDCEILGLQIIPSTITEVIKSNEYKIAVYVKTFSDYHFVRLDSNGNWSEKDGWDGFVEIVKSVKQNKDGYKFVGVFRVSKK